MEDKNISFKDDFEIFNNYPNLKYFDSACVSLKPKVVVDKITEYYNFYPACSGRSSHFLGLRVQKEIEKVRDIAKDFFGAKYNSEIIFTRNATEAINIVASSYNFEKTSYVVVSDKEHNSNLLPWMRLESLGKIKLKILKTINSQIDLNEFEDFLKNNKVSLVAINYASNIDGHINPVDEIIKIAHKNNALVLLDCAQAAGHIKIDAQKLDVDFMAISGHKMMGPSGIGLLYGKKHLLEIMNQFLIGGDTVSNVDYPNFEVLPLPNKFEAGLQDYANILGFGAAMLYLNDKFDIIEKKCKQNLNLLFENLSDLPIEILSKKDNNCCVFSFIPKNMDAIQLALVLNEYEICTRAGAFCVHNWFNKNNKKYAIRISLHLYNDRDDVEFLIKVLKEILAL